jgi:hypothetical protein
MVSASTPALSPQEPEFVTTQEAEAYDRWFRAKVAAALASTGPMIPHDKVMAEMRATIETKQRAAASLDA